MPTLVINGQSIAVTQTGRKPQGAHNDPQGRDGKYTDQVSGESYFVKVPEQTSAEIGNTFCELLASAFLKALTQEGAPLAAYRNNFILAEGGILQDDKGNQVFVTVQPFVKADDLIERKKAHEFREPEQAINALTGVDKKGLGAALFASILMGDYSVHLGNFKQMKGSPIRFDMGAAFRKFMKTGSQSLLDSPDHYAGAMRPDKKYTELWFGLTKKFQFGKKERAIQAQVQQGFVAAAENIELSPEQASAAMFEALRNVMQLAQYQDASLNDWKIIYKHIVGESFQLSKEEKQFSQGIDDVGLIAMIKSKLLDKLSNGMGERCAQLNAEVAQVKELNASGNVMDSEEMPIVTVSELGFSNIIDDDYQSDSASSPSSTTSTPRTSIDLHESGGTEHSSSTSKSESGALNKLKALLKKSVEEKKDGVEPGVEVSSKKGHKP